MAQRKDLGKGIRALIATKTKTRTKGKQGQQY